MESKISGYKLVPAINNCEGCAFEKNRSCPLTKSYNFDCIWFDPSRKYIYVPADTAIEVPKTNQQEK